VITGIYGMNFDFMPELHWKIGYPLALILMAVVSILMITYFRRRKWL
jgi:magnesium transporter